MARFHVSDVTLLNDVDGFAQATADVTDDGGDVGVRGFDAWSMCRTLEENKNAKCVGGSPDQNDS